ncbi:MAG: sulfite exporter TauE/SafE family protein [Sphingobacterium sp.]|uniref:sulfite exporter TauE/SafE family protein n=1 Tax=Sphingobacterium sp. JB170 TaxID=1434842 RepID=UPI000B3618C7|nr:sulfite exporter TauE/SafE family protein [Sphingobacterium sp. JB170]
MMILGFILALLVGVTLGLVGSGGTILTVPIMVYALEVDPVLATTYSLFAIGVTSLVGSIRGVYNKEVDFNKISLFGLPSLLMVFVTRSYILPLVPEIIVIGRWEFMQDLVLMMLFACVMLVAGLVTIRGANVKTGQVVLPGNVKTSMLVVQGLIVGLVTGVVGAGGGFLIIPALINFNGMSMKRAVSTSLVIISINSFFGILGDVEKFPTFDWSILIGYTSLAIIGIFVGFKLSIVVSGTKLRTGFGVLLLFVAMYIILRELYLGH